MLTCQLLGPVEVWSDDERIDLGYPRQRTLLAILLVEANRVVTIDSLIDRIWGDHPPNRAAHTLYADLSKLRRQALNNTSGLHLVRHAGGYLIEADPRTIDLHHFRELVARTHRGHDDEQAAALLDEALALWRDNPFADLDNPWLNGVRTSLNSEKLAATLERNDAYLRLGRHAQLLADLATATAAHPQDERLTAQYMLALYRSGRSADALAHYQQARERTVDELGVDPGPELQELHGDILRNEASLRTTITSTPAPLPVPRQLPAHAPYFVGRATELRQLTELLDSSVDAGGTVVISAISGTGGIGKTWLALHWAHQNLDRFPDGQLFIDLRGFTPGEPLAPATAVRGFLDGLGVDPGRIPIDLDAQAALYRSMLVGKRMLIVLDNAADAAQVTPLLPGSPTCTTVITSRRYLPSLATGHNAHHIQLDALTETEARDLLRVRFGADRLTTEAEAVETLLARCGGFPLALGIVIGRALAHLGFPLSVLAAELGDTTSALGALDNDVAAASLPTVLSWSVQALTAEQARVFRLLGIAPGPDISLPAAAALAGIPTARVRAVLRELEHASLVQQHLPGRYRMHDLIRLYATDTAHDDLTAEVREAALRRVVDFYTHTAYAADLLLYPHRRRPIALDPPVPGVDPQPLPDDPAALAWFEIEHLVLMAALHTTTSHAWHRATWQLAWALDTFLNRRGYRHDQFTLWQAALDATGHLPDPAARIIAHRAFGGCHAALGRHDEGIEHLRRALALAEQHDSPYQQARTHRVLAWAWERRGDDRSARAHATRALDIVRTLHQPVWEANALNAVGWCAARLGDYDVARTHCQAALALHRDHDHPEGAANSLDSLGYIAHHSGHHQQAVGHYQQALDLHRTLGNTYEAASTLDALGHPHTALGQHEPARAAWREALRLYQQQGRDDDAARVEHQLDDLDKRWGG